MYHTFIITLLGFAVSVLAGRGGNQASFYTNSNHIVELTPSTFDEYVFGSNYTTIVEFYAPWCGHCANLKPEYERASKQGHHYAQFAAVNCDKEENKQFCASQNIKGFPTIVSYKPPKKFNDKKSRKQQFITQPYENERSSSKLLDFAKSNLKSYSKSVKIDKLEKFLSDNRSTVPKVLLLSDKYQVSPIYKSLAIDFMNKLDFYHIFVRDEDHETKIAELIPTQNISYPSLLFIDHTGEITVYDDGMKKSAISAFLTEFVAPVEGPFSNRHKEIEAVKSGKFKSFKQYRKKLQKDKVKKATLEKDEL